MVKATILATSLVFVSAKTFAQEYAVVVNVEPKHALVEQKHCTPVDPHRVEIPTNTGGAVLGAIGGAYIGNQIGKGSSKDITTAAGAVIGYNIGAGSRSTESTPRQVCKNVVVHSQNGEVVTFEYRGRRFRVNFDF